MRQVSPATNLVLACLAVLCLVATFDLPWFAPPVEADPELGQIEQAASRFAGVFEHADTATSGRDAFADAHVVLAAIPALVIGLCVLMAVPALRASLRDVLRTVAFFVPVVVAYLVLVRPGAEGDLHWGALAALAVAVFTASAAFQGSMLKGPRPVPGAWSKRAV